ncbi:glycosyltransferase [Mariniphaga sediminis]|uniref:Glycosyltransferase n=1 Tax=Mariniphaga sediminis TaxID=1628158 RepID=A0A399CXP2_9BACT|nr:glycosyltransferase [Mariniphaga sediminis]RIH63242.1 glycosyltransferase [Mariniphaga sediminis]
MNVTISACLIVYNEEKVIERCLKSIHNIVDEIIIVHDGECFDNTISIAKKYTEKIFIRKHQGMCEAHKKFAYSMTKSDWILSIDADEYLSHEIQKNIKILVKDESIDAYAFIWPYTDGKKQFSLKFPYRLCLARKSKMYQWNFPHQPMKTYGKVAYLPYIIEHWPLYDNYSLKTFKTKQKNWIKKHTKYILEDIANIDGFNVDSKEEIIRIQNFYRNRPLFKIIPIFIKILLLQIYGGQYRSGLNGLKVAFIAASYEANLLLSVYRHMK